MRETERERERERERDRDRQTDRQTGRQTDRGGSGSSKRGDKTTASISQKNPYFFPLLPTLRSCPLSGSQMHKYLQFVPTDP